MLPQMSLLLTPRFTGGEAIRTDTSSFNALDIPITQAKKDLCADLIYPPRKVFEVHILVEK